MKALMMEEKYLSVLPQHPEKSSGALFQENYLQVRDEDRYGGVFPNGGYCQYWQ
jgi:hypothetical protein